jgi:hypothetical protein
MPPIVDFPKPEIDPEELIRRRRVEAERLSRLPTVEWMFYLDDSAKRLDMPRATLEAAVKALIAEKEKAEREAKAETRRQEARAEKAAARKKRQAEKAAEKAAERKTQEKEREFKALRQLPAGEQGRRLDAIATRLKEDPAVVRDEFEESAPAPGAEEVVELWPEPVGAEKLLADLRRQIQRYIVVHDHAATAVALWVMLSWVHNAIAIHSPYLVVTSAEPDSGKTTLLGVLERLTFKPRIAIELTGPTLYREVDQIHPTLIIDEADTLFLRKRDLLHIIKTIRSSRSFGAGLRVGALITRRRSLTQNQIWPVSVIVSQRIGNCCSQSPTTPVVPNSRVRRPVDCHEGHPNRAGESNCCGRFVSFSPTAKK